MTISSRGLQARSLKLLVLFKAAASPNIEKIYGLEKIVDWIVELMTLKAAPQDLLPLRLPPHLSKYMALPHQKQVVLKSLESKIFQCHCHILKALIGALFMLLCSTTVTQDHSYSINMTAPITGLTSFPKLTSLTWFTVFTIFIFSHMPYLRPKTSLFPSW